MTPTTSSLSILIIEDDATLRKRLARSIEEAGYRTFSGDRVEILKQASLPPGIAAAVLDMRLPGANGIQAMRLLREHDPDLPIIFMSGESQPAEIIEGMKLGAIEFLLKPFSLDELLAAIERGAAITRQRLARLEVTSRARDRLARLTQREREVLALLVQGHKTGDAAKALGMAPGTAKIHRMHALEKLQAHSVAEVVAWLRESGLDSVPAQV